MTSKPITGWARIVTVAAVGFAVGLIVNSSFSRSPFTLRTQIAIYPAAYQLPKMPGGTSLRMAMLHDVLLERYLRHGTAWYEERNKQSRATIQDERSHDGPPTARLFDAMDDLAVGLENLHKSDEAVAVMREKLKLLPPIPTQPPLIEPTNAGDYAWDVAESARQIHAAESLSPEMHQQYTARANLGTSLIHGAFPKMLAGDSAAQAQMEEGVQDINQAIAINPGAHFGRETWQAIVVRHFLAVANHPDLLTHFDMIGDDLTTLTSNQIPRFSGSNLRFPAGVADSAASPEKRFNLRQLISPITPSPAWTQVVNPGIPARVPFDEPALALIGMWMLGGGPSPHSALALANIALQIGQLEIAWDGYERALEMQNNFSPNPTVRDTLVAYCQKQQAAIATKESPDHPDAWAAQTRQRHNSELAWARTYQDQYHAWEAQQIAANIPLDNPSFYTSFFKNHPSIASPIGDVDQFTVRFLAPDGMIDGLPLALLSGGLCMMLAALTAKPRR